MSWTLRYRQHLWLAGASALVIAPEAGVPQQPSSLPWALLAGYTAGVSGRGAAW
jgi:hypothetical protein